MKAEEVIQEVARLCRCFHAEEVLLFGSRAKGTARERSDIDIAVAGTENFQANLISDDAWMEMLKASGITSAAGIYAKNLRVRYRKT